MERLLTSAPAPASASFSFQQPVASTAQNLAAPQYGETSPFRQHFRADCLKSENRLNVNGNESSAVRCREAGLHSLLARRLRSDFTGDLPQLTCQRTDLGQGVENWRGCRVTCMAHPRRIQMVAQQIGRELSSMLIHDKILKEALVPESALGSDMFLSSVATISEVEVSADLQVAKVFVSVFGDQRGRDIAMEGLRSKQGYVRAGLGKRMKLRMTPEVRFIEDDSLERGARVLAIINKLKDEREKRDAGQAVPHNADANDYDLDEEEIRPVKQERRKKAVAVKKSPKVEPGTQFSWGDKENPLTYEDVKDLDFGEDENIIFVK